MAPLGTRLFPGLLLAIPAPANPAPSGHGHGSVILGYREEGNRDTSRTEQRIVGRTIARQWEVSGPQSGWRV